MLVSVHLLVTCNSLMKLCDAEVRNVKHFVGNI